MIKKTIIAAIFLFTLYLFSGCLDYPRYSHEDYARSAPFPSDIFEGFKATIKLEGKDTIGAEGDSMMIIGGEIDVELIDEYPLRYMQRYRLEIDSLRLCLGAGSGCFYFILEKSYINKILFANLKPQFISLNFNPNNKDNNCI